MAEQEESELICLLNQECISFLHKEWLNKAQGYVDEMKDKNIMVKKIKRVYLNGHFSWHAVHNGKVLKAPIPSFDYLGIL